MAEKRVDWESFADEIRDDVLDVMGSEISVFVTETSTRAANGKKIPGTVTEYKGLGVRGTYEDDFKSRVNSIIKAGDVPFTCQFEDRNFEPTEKKDEKIVFEGETYTVIYVEETNPAGTNIIWTIYGRKV